MALNISSFAERFRNLRELLHEGRPQFDQAYNNRVSHNNHLWNFIVQLGCLLVVTEQRLFAFQGTVTRREDQSKTCVQIIQVWSQDPSYKQKYKYKTLNLLSQKILPPQVGVISLLLWHNWNRIQSPLKSRVEIPLISEESGLGPRSHCHTAAKPSRAAVYQPAL